MKTLLLSLALALPFTALADDVDQISRVKKVSEGIYRGARPTEGKFEDLADAGIRTILDLQGEASALVPGETQRSRHNRQQIAEGLGMRYINIATALSDLSDPADRADVLRAAALMHDRSLQPIYVHCAAGKDRTGIAVAAYRIIYQGCTYAQARREFARNGIPVWTTSLMAKQMPFLKSLEKDKSKVTESCPL